MEASAMEENKNSFNGKHECQVCFIIIEKEASVLPLEHRCADEKICRECLQKWFESCELTGQQRLPTCPQCRDTISFLDCGLVLGRDYKPVKVKPLVTFDEFTTTFMKEHNIKACPNCGLCIDKVEETCHLMECLCGYRFCFECGESNAICTCGNQTHWFWDNVNERIAGDAAFVVAQNDDLEDLKSFLSEKKSRLKRNEDELENKIVFEVFNNIRLQYYTVASHNYNNIRAEMKGEIPVSCIPTMLRLLQLMDRRDVERLFPGIAGGRKPIFGTYIVPGRTGMGRFGKRWYPCVVIRRNEDHTLKVKWTEDGTVTSHLPKSNFLQIFGQFENNGGWDPCLYLRTNHDLTIKVQKEDDQTIHSLPGKRLKIVTYN